MPASRHRDDDVGGADGMVGNLLRRIDNIVFSAFGAFEQRREAAGEEIEQPFVRPAEGRGQLDAVLHRDAARGAGAGIGQPPTR